MKILITGKDGFIAKKLQSKLSSSGVELLCTTSKPGDPAALKLDLNEPELFDYKTINKGDIVLMLAAVSSPDFCEKNYDEAYKINVIGTKYFIENVIKNDGSVIFFSSDMVFGIPKNGEWFDENSPLNQYGKYAEMKAEIELEFANVQNVKIIRLSYVFSKEDKYTSYLQKCHFNHEVAEIFDPFDRCAIYIEDVMHGILSMIHNFDSLENNVFNFCGPELVSRKKIAYEFAKYHPGFQMEVTQPQAEFFKARPKVLKVKSLYFEKLLGRKPTTIEEAMKLEFAPKT